MSFADPLPHGSRPGTLRLPLAFKGQAPERLLPIPLVRPPSRLGTAREYDEAPVEAVDEPEDAPEPKREAPPDLSESNAPPELGRNSAVRRRTGRR